MGIEGINKEKLERLEFFANNELYSKEYDLKKLRKQYYNTAFWESEDAVSEMLDDVMELLFEVEIWKSFEELIAGNLKSQGWYYEDLKEDFKC
jgi:hypothetical protein